MNEENLIPNSKRSPSELREQTRKGGIASGKKRREQKLLKTTALTMLNAIMDESSEKAKANKESIKKKFNLKGNELTYNSAILAVQIANALKGDLKSAKWLQEVTDQLATQKHEVTGKDGEALMAGFTIEVIDKREHVDKQEETDDGAKAEDTDNEDICGD